MKYFIEPREGYVHAELQNRETAGEMREFLGAVKAACLQYGCPSILVSIRGSRAVFKPEEYGLGSYADEMSTPACRVALLGDSSELHHAHEYIELIARQQGHNVRAFRELQPAVRWLQARDDDAVLKSAPSAFQQPRRQKSA